MNSHDLVVGHKNSDDYEDCWLIWCRWCRLVISQPNWPIRQTINLTNKRLAHDREKGLNGTNPLCFKIVWNATFHWQQVWSRSHAPPHPPRQPIPVSPFITLSPFPLAIPSSSNLSKLFCALKKRRVTDGPTDQQTDVPTDRPSYITRTRSEWSCERRCEWSSAHRVEFTCFLPNGHRINHRNLISFSICRKSTCRIIAWQKWTVTTFGTFYARWESSIWTIISWLPSQKMVRPYLIRTREAARAELTSLWVEMKWK